MSLTQDIKEELCRQSPGKSCCCRAECYGLLLFAAMFSASRLRLQSDHPAVRRRARLLLRQAVGAEWEERPDCAHALTLEDPEALARVFAAFGYEYKNAALHLNRAVVEESCCCRAFLRGAFLAGGYLSAPGKGYHLELTISHYNAAKETALLLEEMGLPCGFVARRGNYVLYYKDSAVIEDIIGQMGAPAAAMAFRLKKVEKDFRNNLNRKVNCETANLDKTVEAAARQCLAIRALQQAGVYESLPQALRQTAQIRLEHPEESLSELLRHFDPPISKPGLSNRMRKLEQEARRLKEGGAAEPQTAADRRNGKKPPATGRG